MQRREKLVLQHSRKDMSHILSRPSKGAALHHLGRFNKKNV
jgi:hypothetical protein